MSKHVLESVAFDSRWCGQHGIGRYASELEAHIHFGNRVLAVCSPTSAVDCLFLSVWRLCNWRVLTFSPGYNAPLIGLSRYVFTVHDLNHIDVAESRILHSIYYRLVLRNACRKAAAVLTVSEFSRQRIIEWANIKPEKVTVVGNGVSPIFRPEGEEHRPGYPYYLMVSNRKPHKNEEMTLKAFSKAEINSNTKVLITGFPTKRLSDCIHDLALEGRVVFLGRCNDEQLASYYRGATALLFVSLYEGFGLPVVEAMACGTPVIASNVCSLPEIGEGASVLVDPRSVAQIVAAIEMIENCDDAFRSALIDKGFQRAKSYQWKGVADKVSAVLKRLVQK